MNEQQIREAPLSELLKGFQRDLTDLMDTEKKLAKQELSNKVNELKRDGAELGAAAGTLVLGAMCLVACLILLLAMVMAAWVAALIVGLALCAIGGGLLMKFRSDVKRFDPVPRETMVNLQRDQRALREAVR